MGDGNRTNSESQTYDGKTTIGQRELLQLLRIKKYAEQVVAAYASDSEDDRITFLEEALTDYEKLKGTS